MSDPTDEHHGSEEAPALKTLRGVLAKQRDLPATSYGPRRLGIAAADLEIRVQHLAELALVDPALMVRLLRMANSTTYQTRDRTDVVSVRRAIALMGHDQVRADARQLPTFKDRVPVEHHDMVRAEVAQTIFAVRLARDLLDMRNPLLSDEGATTVALARLAAIMMAIVTPHEVCALRWVQRHHPGAIESTTRELFGASEEQINREIIETWRLPRSVLSTLGRAVQRPRIVEHARDWLPLAVGLALEVAATTRIESRTRRDDCLMDIVRRYARPLDIDGPRLDALLEDSGKEVIGLERSLGCPATELAVGPLLKSLLRRDDRAEEWWAAMERVDLTGVITRFNQRHAQPVFDMAQPRHAKAHDADEQLAQLGDELDELIATYSEVEADGQFTRDGETAWDRIATRIAPQLLGGFQRVLRFDSAMLFLRTATGRPYDMAASSPPRNSHEPALSAASDSADLFTAAMKNRVDLHIADCTSDKIRSRLPVWFTQRFDAARGFVFLPLASAQTAPGFILAVWNRVEPDGVNKTELAQLRRIRDGMYGVLERFAPGHQDRVQDSATQAVN